MDAPSAHAVLSAADISIGYRRKKHDTVVASGISLNLIPGKLVALAGANGIGKSTLLRTLTGIQSPLAGNIALDGKPVSSYNAIALAQKLSLVLTDRLPPSNLTVYELVALGRQPYTNWLGALTDEDRKKVKEALQMTQLEELADKKHYQVSDGQLQRALIARALTQDTPLVVLDEPTTHLDLVHKVSLLKLLKQLIAETGKCILYSTHDLDLALQLSDEMIVMAPGSVVQGTPDTLIAQGTFTSLFNDPSITFDSVKKGFTFLP